MRRPGTYICVHTAPFLALGTPAARPDAPRRSPGRTLPFVQTRAERAGTLTLWPYLPGSPHAAQGVLTVGRQIDRATFEIPYVGSRSQRLAEGGVGGDPRARRWGGAATG